MEIENKTGVIEFILLGFPELHQYQLLLFIIILLAYTLCVLGNMTIISLVKLDPLLHSPMYLFISTFAVLDIGFVTVTVPKLLINLIAANNSISFVGCFVQMFVYDALGATECYILLVMAFDQDLAINNPLRYPTIMTRTICIELAVLPWITGLFIACVLMVATVTLEFCGPNEMNHFFCDLPPLQNLACSSSFVSKVLTMAAAVLNIIFPFSTIMSFYIHIINTVLKIKGSEGQKKAFSTCSSHLIVALMFFGTALIVYINAKGNQYDKYLALLYTVLTPLLNPFIYTFRNRDVKEAIKKLIYRGVSLPSSWMATY
ncbi:olfactory receptor 6N1-like [Pelobates fuscus]|uniref:olfactory receptor 6N1-like n=1 Tax=Pelobates fuscus TaxID=191477 RepID=UPI002FE440D3